MSELVLLRHGPTAWTQQSRLQGRRDVPLSPQGRAMVLGWKLPDRIFTHKWYSSPLLRARETAQLLGGRDIVSEPRLIEMDWAHWEGKTLLQLRQANHSAMAANESLGLDFRPEGGESPRELLARLQPWFNEIGKAGKPVFAVAHKGVIRAMMAKASGWDMIGKPPVKTKWGTLHVFEVDQTGSLQMMDGVEIMAERS